MVIDTIQNWQRYVLLHPLFERAFKHMLSIDWQEKEPEKYELSNDLRGILTNQPGKSMADSLSKFECHNAHIDIQYCISGQEKIGWKSRGSCKSPKGMYDPIKDVQFFEDQPDFYFTLQDHQFAIFFPEDVHAPMIGDGLIKKLVLKVTI
jgi:biofilm protein TabA